MAGFNNPNENNYFGNDYVNFNQFLMQHNLGGQNQFFNYEQPNMPQQPFLPNMGGYDGQGMQQVPSQHFNNELVLNSNLVPTASEFVPHFPVAQINSSTNTNTSTNTNLLATASEFIPKVPDFSSQYSPPSSTGDKSFYGSSATAPSATADGLGAFQTSVDNNNKVWNEAPAPLEQTDTRPGSEKMLAALSLSEETARTNGGAIKKSTRSAPSRDARRGNNDYRGSESRRDQRDRNGGKGNNEFYFLLFLFRLLGTI